MSIISTYNRGYRLIAILFLLGILSILGDSWAEPPAPKIQFQKPEHHFGSVLSGTVARHEFIFKNVGSADLVISNVVFSCGCTTTDTWTKRVKPGGEGRIPVEFNSTGMLGEVQKSVAIRCNDPESPSVVLLLGGNFWRPLEVQPSVALIQMPPRTDQPLSTTVRIVNRTAQALKLEPPVSSVPQIRARIEEVTAGKEYHLILETVPPLAHQDISAVVRCSTSWADNPEISIPVIVIAQPEIMVSPRQLFLPAIPPDSPEPYVIKVSSQAVDPITVTEGACDAPGSEVIIREVTPGREFELAVSFPDELTEDLAKSYVITARTSHPDHPEVRISVAFARSPNEAPRRIR